MHWEYLTTRDDADLANLGQQGWELVAALPAGGGDGHPTFYMKRPAPDFRTEVTEAQKRRYYDLLNVQHEEQP